MQCNYNSFIQIIDFQGFFRNALRCRKTGACRILMPLRYSETALTAPLADCLLWDSHRNVAIWAFWEKAAIGHALSIFNPVIVYFELFQCPAILSKLKRFGHDNFFKMYMYPKNIFWYVKGTQFRSPIAPTFRVKGSSSNEIILQ